MTPPRHRRTAGKSGRRDELLDIAATLFAERGLRATTVRDIADAAGILSGSLYHHFDSKESMVDEILRGFLDDLFGKYREIVASGLDSRATLEALVTTSYEAIDASHSAVAIYQDEVKHLVANERFAYLSELNTEFRELWMGVLEAGVDGRQLPVRHRRRARLPIPPRHRLGRRPLVPARWLGHGRHRGQAVPLDRPRRTCESPQLTRSFT